MTILWEDYSKLGKGQEREIDEFAKQILKQELVRHSELLKKTKAKKIIEKPVRKISPMLNPDRNLNRVTESLKKIQITTTRVIENGDYENASTKAKKRFNYWIRKVISGLEDILNEP